MKILKVLLITVIGLAGLLLLVAFLLPDQVRVSRSITIARPAAQVFAVINNLKRFNDWSPWHGLDPNTKYSYSGPDAGVGAAMRWESEQDNVGRGSQIIVESVADKQVKVQLDFGDMGKPIALLSLAPEGEGVVVTWTLDSKFEGNPIFRYIGLMLDGMVGKDYEKGLAQLKTLVESAPVPAPHATKIEIIDVVAAPMLFVSSKSSKDPAEITRVMTAAYAEITAFMTANKISFAGPVISITTAWDDTGWTFDAAIPVDRTDVPPTGNIKIGSTYAGKVVSLVHVGPYEQLEGSVNQLLAYVQANGLVAKDRLYEEFVSDPATTPADQLITNIRQPIE